MSGNAAESIEWIPRSPRRGNVVIARQELVMPPATNFDEAHKFGVLMLKAVLDGGAASSPTWRK